MPQGLTKYVHLDAVGYMRKLAEEDTEESATRVNNLSELFNMILDFEKEELYGLTDEESSEKKGLYIYK
jgi:hypothetical protein